MSGLRATPGVFEKVRHLPNLLPCVCIPWQAAWCGKIKLVGMLPVADSRPLTALAGSIHSTRRPFFNLARLIRTIEGTNSFNSEEAGNQEPETRITGENNGH